MTISRRILVTGAGGFVGSWLVDRLARGLPAKVEVMAAGRSDQSPVRGVDLDVTQADDVASLVADFRPDCVVHLAGISSLNEARTEARKAWDVNLFGTMNVAEAVMRHTPEARLIYAGSSEVYGGSFNVTGGTVDETALLDPRNPYATTKAAADLMLGQMAEMGLQSVRFRLFNHTGPGQSTDFAVPAFACQIAAIERGERPPVIKVGNLDAQRDFCDVRDVIEAYIAAIVVPNLPGGIVFNIASGVPRRMGDVLEALLGMSRIAIRVAPEGGLMRPSDVPITAGNARRAADLLSWTPTVPWNNTLYDVLAAHRGPLYPLPRLPVNAGLIPGQRGGVKPG